MLKYNIALEGKLRLVPMQLGDAPVIYANTMLLEQNFGFKPSIPLCTGFRRFAEWYAKDRNV